MALAACATIDFESRSEIDLADVGTWVYSMHPTTQILCMAFKLPEWTETYLWHPAFPEYGVEEYCEDWERLEALLVWIDDGGLVEAHNAWFERCMWTNILGPTHGWPAVPPESWRCSAAKAAALALPRKLEKLTPALRLQVEKDMGGNAVMKKMTSPRKSRKAERDLWANQHGAGKCVGCKGRGTYKRKPCAACSGKGELTGNLATVPPMPTLWHFTPELFATVCDYCRVDVLVEEEASRVMPDLSEDEQAIYLLDQRINERGFGLDPEAIEAALWLIDYCQRDLNQELALLTEGEVERASQKARLKVWLEDHGLVLENMQRETLEEAVERSKAFGSEVHRAVEIAALLSRSSTAKYEAMAARRCADNRARGELLYHGASTGRWTGSGIQPQNFPRGTIKQWNMETAWAVLKSRDIALITRTFGNILEALAQALRGVIVPTPGYQFYVADYSSIEARVLQWLAEDDKALAIFRSGADPYLDMASDIYGYPCNKQDHPTERKMGKEAILGLGYQMGWSKFIDRAALAGVTIDEEFSRRVVDAYRSKYWRVKAMWQAQQDAAIAATRGRGKEVVCGRIVWVREERFLFATLPSGRRLAYADPEVHQRPTPWGTMADSLSFMGVNPKNKQWTRQTTYGGSLVENQTQAVARDLMASALLRCEESGTYIPVLSVHDEAVAEALLGEGDVHEFEQLVSELPWWAEGLPVSAESWKGPRYRK